MSEAHDQVSNPVLNELLASTNARMIAGITRCIDFNEGIEAVFGRGLPEKSVLASLDSELSDTYEFDGRDQAVKEVEGDLRDSGVRGQLLQVHKRIAHFLSGSENHYIAALGVSDRLYDANSALGTLISGLDRRALGRDQASHLLTEIDENLQAAAVAAPDVSYSDDRPARTCNMPKCRKRYSAHRAIYSMLIILSVLSLGVIAFDVFDIQFSGQVLPIWEFFAATTMSGLSLLGAYLIWKSKISLLVRVKAHGWTPSKLSTWNSFKSIFSNSYGWRFMVSPTDLSKLCLQFEPIKKDVLRLFEETDDRCPEFVPNL